MQTKRQQLVQDWQAIHDKIRQYPWAAHILDTVRTDTDWWVRHYADDAAYIAGWGHNYFCLHCSSALVFDPAKPEEHRCSRCGIERRDADTDEAWRYSYRTRASVQVFHAAVLFNLTGETEYMQFIRRVLTFYADHLDAFRVRVPAGFEGRFSGTNLTDAVSICWLLNGMELVKKQFAAEELSRYKADFFLPMAEFLHRKPGGTPNISCWMKSALGMIGLFFDERDWCRLAADGEEGITRWLNEGLLPSGFWYESSFHYHFYCAEGLTYYAAFCGLYGYDQAGFTDAIRRMYRYPVPYAFPNGLFPSPNDGWPMLGFANYAHQYEWIRNVFDEPLYRYALAQCYEDPDEAGHPGDRSTTGGGLPRLLFGTDWRGELERAEREHPGAVRPVRESRHDDHIHYALLQNEQASVFLKYGFVIREHSHADIMNFELFLGDGLVSRDISNSGYGSDLFREWQRKSIAHNTVMLDRHNQPNRPHGRLLEFRAADNLCRVAADDVYPGWTFTRSLQLLPDRLQDEFVVAPAIQADTGAAAHTHTFDWFFHASGEIDTRLPMQPAEPPGEADGYSYMQQVACCETDDDWEISWVLPGKRVTLAMEGHPGTVVYVFQGPEHRADLLRWGVMVRRTGADAVYRAEYRFD